jgi:hypothetical protein
MLKLLRRNRWTCANQLSIVERNRVRNLPNWKGIVGALVVDDRFDVCGFRRDRGGEATSFARTGVLVTRRELPCQPAARSTVAVNSNDWRSNTL